MWRSFELDPAAAPSGAEQCRYAEKLARKYGMPAEQAQTMIDAMTERLDHATFGEGSPPSDHAALRAHAVEIGLPADDVETVLASALYADAVRADEEQAREYGISGVLFFVIDGRYGISGAQPADVVLEALDRAWAEHVPLTVLAASTASGDGSSKVDACEGDFCAR